MIKFLQKLLVLVLYFISSVATVLINKVIIGTYSFSMHYFLIVVQSAVIITVVLIYYSISSHRPDMNNIKKWYVASILLTAMIFTNIKAMFYFPVTLFTLYKNLSILLMAFLELKFFNKKITLNGFISLFMIVLSSYAVNVSEKVVPVGYFWMIANIISTTAYILYLKKMLVFDQVSRLESVFFTNLLSIPILGVLSFLFDPVNFMTDSKMVWVFVVISSVCAFLTAFSTAWTLKTISSTALCVIGALNKLLLSVGGFTIFHEHAGFLKVLSLFTGLFASALYSYDSIKNIPEIPQPLAADNV